MKCQYYECQYDECQYAECHYAKCHYAECHHENVTIINAECLMLNGIKQISLF